MNISVSDNNHSIQHFTDIVATVRLRKSEDTKGVIRNCKWKKDRQHNGQKKKSVTHVKRLVAAPNEQQFVKSSRLWFVTRQIFMSLFTRARYTYGNFNIRPYAYTRPHFRHR